MTPHLCSESPQLFQDDQDRQRGETTPPAPAQEAIPEQLAEGGSEGVTWGQVFAIISSILVVIALIVLCILGKFVVNAFSFL